MTSSHLRAADRCFWSGTCLLLIKFWSWEEVRFQETIKKWAIFASTTISLVAATFGVSQWNHSINRPHPSQSAGHSGAHKPPSMPSAISIAPPNGSWFTAWGDTTLPNTIRSTVNVTTIIPYRNRFNVMLVYFVQNRSIDKENNSKIMKSSLFSVHRSEPYLTIDTPVDPQILHETFGDETGLLSSEMNVALVILPLSVNPQKISKLSDAAHLRAGVFCCDSFPFSVIARINRNGKRVILMQR